LGESLFAEADTVPELHEMIQDAVAYDFDEGKAPNLLRLHFVREEVLAV
jgi:hypothetical protein